MVGFAFQQILAPFVEAMGRNTTLTGRTDIWDDLFRMDKSPWLGTGFESFWLGDRAKYFWDKYYFHPNQAHNGYIETYLNLGWVGVGFLAFLIVAGYRNIVQLYRRDASAGSLRLAFFVVALLYDISEAAFNKVIHPVWIACLLAVTALPALLPSDQEARAVSDAPAGVPENPRRQPARVAARRPLAARVSRVGAGRRGYARP